MPTLYVGYFFNLNGVTLTLYGFLIVLTLTNSYNVYVLMIFLFLLDIPIVYGVLGILMKIEHTRPYIYHVLGEDNVRIFLGNPGKTAITLATRAGLVAVTALGASIAGGAVQDLANANAAQRYVDICTQSNVPINPQEIEYLFNRNTSLDLRKWGKFK